MKTLYIVVAAITLITIPVVVNSQIVTLGIHKDSILDRLHIPRADSLYRVVALPSSVPIREADSTFRTDYFIYKAVKIADIEGDYKIGFQNDTVAVFVWSLTKRPGENSLAIFFDLMSYLSSIFGTPNYIHVDKEFNVRSCVWLMDDDGGYFLS